ncbi:MAG TPA: Ig-like domain-containing protein, partial [Gemmatimonadaceae bacterium]|nr:Ig-like domain-containing protein [Gemmatimonadaceae bacterium]
MRTTSRFAACVLLILSSITCTDGPTAPRSAGGPTVLSILPSFSVAGQQTMRDLGAFGLTVDNIHIHIDHPPAEPFDMVVAVPAGADVVTLNLPVLLNAPTEQLNVHIELRQGPTVLYSGTQTVTASVGATTTAPPATIPIVYVGPGADLRNFAIAPHDTAILISGTVPFRVTATDATGAAAIGVQIHWTVANATLGAVDAASGVFTPAGNSGTTVVIASTPNGLRDSATVIVSALPAKLVLVSGGSQTGAAGSALAQAVVVQVQAANGSPVAGAAVAFGGGTGGATANPATATTGADGDAQTVVTLGHGSGAQTIVASVAGVSDLTIAAAATAAAAASVAKVSGDAQDDTLGAVLKPFVVAVTDAFGNPVAGASVKWTRIAGSGTVAAASTTTDAAGQASVGYTLGHTAGTDTVRATLSGISGAAVNFTATGHLRATRITIASGDGQSALPGAVLPLPLTVLVADSTGKPVAGATVTWTAISPGTLNPATSVSDSLGHASTTMTLGSSGGAYFVSASLAGGLSVQFTETAVRPVTDGLHFVAQPSNVVSATYITPNIQVELLTAAGHRDTAGVGASATVALSVLHGPAGGHVRDSVGFAADTVHAVKGLATFRVGNDIVGTYKLLATSPVARSDSSASYVVSVGPAKHVQYVAGPGQLIAAIDTTTLRPTVQVQDDGGNPVSGASVTWVVDSGGGTLVDPLNPTTPASSVVTTSNASGKSAVQWWLGSAGGQTMRAYLTSGTGRDTVPFSTGVYGAGSQLVVTSVMDTTYASGTHLPLVVQVEDINGNPVPMAGVPVAIYLNYYFCTGACDRGPAGSRPAYSRAPGQRAIAAGVRPPRANLAPMRWPAPSISRSGRMTPNRTGTLVPAPQAARARAGLGISKSVTAGGAYDYGSGVFDSLPVPTYPTLVGDTVVMTDSTGKAVFANLDIAGLAGPGYPMDVSVSDTSYSLSGTYTNPFHLTPGAPYGVYAAYDSVHQATGKLAIDVPEAVVVDSLGNYVPNAPVTFAVTAGGGSLDSTLATTDAYGDPVQVPGWALGSASGVNTVRASATVSGPKTSATLVATAHQPAAIVLATGLTASIVDSTVLSPSPEATIADATKTWALNDSGVVITPGVILVPPVSTDPQPLLIGNTSPVTTSPTGTASFVGLGVYGTRGSTVALVASASGLRSDTSAVVSITSGPAASIGVVAGEALDSTHAVGASTRQVQVVVKDAAGFPVMGNAVYFAITNFSTNQCLISGSTAQYVYTNAQGVANAVVTLPSSAASCMI